MEQIVNSITNLREHLAALIEAVNKHKISAEMTLAYRSLQMCRGWLGKSKAALGMETPYTVADSVDKIPPVADVSENKYSLDQGDHLANINALRKELQDVVVPSIIDILNLATQSEQSRLIIFTLENAYRHAEEASMWLGFELQRLKEIHDNSNKP